MRIIWLLAGLIAGTPMWANAETFDSTFDSDGKVLFNLSNININGKVVAALPMPNGDVVHVFAPSTVGTCQDTACLGVLRYSPAGALLGGSILQFGLSSLDAAALDGSGRVVVVGTIAGGATGRDIAVIRLGQDLLGDPTFSPGGIAVHDFNNNNNYAKAVAIDAQDNIVVVGSTFYAPSDSDFLVMRLRSNGSLDTTFSGAGKTSIPFDLGSPPLDQANAVAIGNDGKILIGGFSLDGTISRARVAMARLLPNGGYDTTFCANGCSANPGYPAIKNGRTIYYFGSNTPHTDELFGMDAYGNNGFFVISGATYADDGSNRRGAIARFEGNGEYYGESLQDGLAGNATFRSVRSADAAGSRFIVSGTSGPGDVFYSLQAFDATPAPLLNYGNGNCVSNNSGFCFTSSDQFGDVGPNTAGVLNLDSSGRPLFSGSGIANVSDTTSTLITARFTNTTGPKLDRIFRSGFN